MRLLPRLLKSVIKKGTLHLRGPDGSVETIGGQVVDGDVGPEITLHITEPKYDWKIPLNPELYTGEAYMDGHLIVEDGNIYDLLELFFLNKRAFDLSASQIYWKSLARKLRRFHQYNPVSRSLKNVQHHYDLGNDFYRLFLDDDLQYSCGYYPTQSETLEQAQMAKKRHLAAKLALDDGQTLLDIGCGWGGLSLYLALLKNIKVMGISLSKEQLDIARKRAAFLKLEDRVNFELIDYREVSGRYDRIISVGMLEHVGVGHLNDYFLKVRDLLSDDGLALVHSISSKSPPGITGPFLAKYIFPGGYSPSLSEVFSAVEPSGLWALDVEIWRKHYGFTLRHWRERCLANRDAIIDMYDERFFRMWEFYLAACEGAFQHGSSHVFQMQLSRDREAVALTRDYINHVSKNYALKDDALFKELAASSKAAFEG